jgi:uncharacterized delta-60 repeat protein
MWFLSTHKARRTASSRSARNTFRPSLETLEDRCLLSAGALDASFGSGGTVTGPIEQGTAVVVQLADGKIVVGGDVPSGKSTNFALARCNTNGSLDSTFGPNHNGVVSSAVGKGHAAIAGLALQSNGAIVAVGAAASNTGQDFALARYTATGALDPSFGSGGIVLTAVVAPGAKFASEYASAVAIYPNTGTFSDKIYLAGVCTNALAYQRDFTVIRYNIDGSLDTTFGKGGIVVTPDFGSGLDYATALAIQPADGKIVLAGAVYGSRSGAPNTMAVARYLPSGTLDTTFNPGGILSPGIAGIVTIAPAGTSNTWANGVLVQSSQNNTMVIAGYSSFGLTLTRLASAGQLDTTFGGSGTGFALNSGMTYSGGIIQDPNGDFLITGTSTTSNLAVAAYLPGGTPDVTFGTGGIATTSFSGGAQGNAIAIQPSDGKIVAAGASNGYIALARFLPPNTKIGSFTGSSASGSVTLTASNIMNSNPTSPTSQVSFYLQNPDLSLTLLGTGTNNSGTWTFSFAESAYGLTSGTTYTFVVQAADNFGVLSDPVTVSLQVM